ncbi:hypothetical protein ASG12_12900 [Williamsia sp. Leaf354]|jgi:hypothetical protein|uniref:hypothetical protein n=1 Tax=Williamsia sp. Leaf354 TaxID=1736349 RepID=UPI000701D83E|nr:hypothetical protein [Williamsia sp. Leaf354]KQR97916.1 hypothetical protein ASG12_12900 [Williamsia sp. Leaf354]
MVRLLALLGVGYVLGAKAGRRRYDQINGAYHAVTGSPATRKAIELGRQKLSEKINPEPPLTRVHQIDDSTTVYAPRDPRD